MTSVSVTEQDVEALLDSHLDAAGAARVREALVKSQTLRDYYTRILLQKELLVQWWRYETGDRG